MSENVIKINCNSIRIQKMALPAPSMSPAVNHQPIFPPIEPMDETGGNEFSLN